MQLLWAIGIRQPGESLYATSQLLKGLPWLQRPVPQVDGMKLMQEAAPEAEIQCRNQASVVKALLLRQSLKNVGRRAEVRRYEETRLCAAVPTVGLGDPLEMRLASVS